MLDKTDLHPYQTRAADYIIDKGSAMLAIDCGLGKTIITLTALEMMRSLGISRKILILGPPRVAAHVWSEEVLKWEHTKHLKVIPLVGTPNKRGQLLEQNSDIYTMSYDLLPWLVDLFGKNSWPFDTVILDESSMVKNHGTRRFRSLRKIRGKINRVICLSGTPAANTLMSLWSQFWLIDKGERLGKTFTGFRDRHYTSDYRGWSWKLRPGADEHIHKAIEDLSISMSAEDYLQLPELIVNRVTIYLPAKVKSQYRELEREFLISISRETEITAINSAVLSNKLRQLVNGCVYDEDGQWHEIHPAKIDALEEIVEQSGSPVLIFYEYRSDAVRIKKRFNDAVDVKESGAIERWNRGEIPILIGHFASMSHGLNLQTGGHTMIFFTLPWSNEIYLQAIGRLHRQGQSNTVICHHLIADKTIDQKVSTALQNKQAVQSALLDSMKEAA